MAEVTRVPLQPIEKGSLTKLWLAVIVAVLIGAGLAWLAMPKGIDLEVVAEGTGPNHGPTDVAFIKYVGKLEDGTEFDKSQDVALPIEGIFPEGNPLPLDSVVPGFRDGLMKMQKGGKYKLFIPSELGYGAEPNPQSPIPPNADLYFDVELVDFMSAEDFQRRIAVLQQMMQQESAGMQQQQQGGQPAPQGQ